MAAASTSKRNIGYLMGIDASVNVPGTVPVKRPLGGTCLGTALREWLIVFSSRSNDIEFLRRVPGSDCIVAAVWTTSSTGSELLTENIATGKREMSMVLTWAGILLDPFASTAWQGLREYNFTGVIAKITNYKTQ